MSYATNDLDYYIHATPCCMVAWIKCNPTKEILARLPKFVQSNYSRRVLIASTVPDETSYIERLKEAGYKKLGRATKNPNIKALVQLWQYTSPYIDLDEDDDNDYNSY